MPTEQRVTFDQVADLYERHRPGYPAALIDALVSLSGIPERARILEIGCGTGQASVPLARRGHALVALEPGANLARIAARNLADFPDARVIERSFEDWALDAGAFDLVMCAQAFHWLSAEIRFSKSRAALRPGGALAVFGSAALLDRSPARAALDAAYAAHAPDLLGRPASTWYAKSGSLEGLFAASQCFEAPVVRHFAWSIDYPQADYLGLLRTYSDHRLLPDDRRATLLDAIAAVIEDHGGHLGIAYEASLYVARRLDDGVGA